MVMYPDTRFIFGYSYTVHVRYGLKIFTYVENVFIGGLRYRRMDVDGPIHNTEPVT